MKIITTESFQKDVRKLKKKYRNIIDDIDIFIDELKAQKIIGDRLQNFLGEEIYKARVKNTFSKAGKSGGFRIIYFIKKEENYYFLSIYSKTVKENITKQEILDSLQELGL